MIENNNSLIDIPQNEGEEAPNERRRKKITPDRSFRDRTFPRKLDQRKWDVASKEMAKGNYKCSALKELFHALEPGIAKNAIGALMSDDESLDYDQYFFDDSESDDDDDDEKKTPSSDKATSTLLGARIEFQERGSPHCHSLLK